MRPKAAAGLVAKVATVQITPPAQPINPRHLKPAKVDQSPNHDLPAPIKIRTISPGLAIRPTRQPNAAQRVPLVPEPSRWKAGTPLAPKTAAIKHEQAPAPLPRVAVISLTCSPTTQAVLHAVRQKPAGHSRRNVKVVRSSRQQELQPLARSAAIQQVASQPARQVPLSPAAHPALAAQQAGHAQAELAAPQAPANQRAVAPAAATANIGSRHLSAFLT